LGNTHFAKFSFGFIAEFSEISDFALLQKEAARWVAFSFAKYVLGGVFSSGSFDGLEFSLIFLDSSF